MRIMFKRYIPILLLRSRNKAFLIRYFLIAILCVSVTVIFYNSTTTKQVDSNETKLALEQINCDQVIHGNYDNLNLVDLVVPNTCKYGFIKWMYPNDGYLRVLFEAVKDYCQKPYENRIQVCVSMSKASSTVWDVTNGVSERKPISLIKNDTQFCAETKLTKQEKKVSKSNRIELLFSANKQQFNNQILEYYYRISC